MFPRPRTFVISHTYFRDLPSSCKPPTATGTPREKRTTTLPSVNEIKPIWSSARIMRLRSIPLSLSVFLRHSHPTLLVMKEHAVKNNLIDVPISGFVDPRISFFSSSNYLRTLFIFSNLFICHKFEENIKNIKVALSMPSAS